MQGILDQTADITAFLNPLTNSYRRFGSFEAPHAVTWSHQNRSQLIRIPASSGESNRMELRSPDPVLATPIWRLHCCCTRGWTGSSKSESLTAPSSGESAEAEAALLPQNLGEALERAQNSAFVTRWLPKGARDSYFAIKQREWQQCCAADDSLAWEQQLFFGRI